MKRLFRVLILLLILAGLAGAAGWFFLQRFLNSEDFAAFIARQISETMYAPVSLKSAELDGTTHAVLTGFRVPMPPAVAEDYTKQQAAESSPEAPPTEPAEPAGAERAEPVEPTGVERAEPVEPAEPAGVERAEPVEPADAERAIPVNAPASPIPTEPGDPKTPPAIETVHEVAKAYPKPPKDMITIETIDARFQGVESFGKDAHLLSLTLEEPKVWMEQLPDGSIAWPAYTPTKPAADAPTMTAEAVTVHNASVVVANRTGFTAVEMQGVDVTGAFSSKQGFVSGSGVVTAKEMWLASIVKMTGFQAKLEISPTRAEMTQMAAELFGGKMTGTMAVDIEPDSQPLDLAVKLAGIRSADFLQALGQTSKLDVGKVDIEFTGKGQMLAPLQVNGSGTFRTGRVDASGIPIMARMQKLAQDTGFASVDFAYMKGTFSMNNGVISFKDVATFPEDQTRIFSTGTVDTTGQVHITGEIHAKGGVAGGIEKFLSNIGLHKAEESLFVVPFTITGTMADPVVKMKGP